MKDFYLCTVTVQKADGSSANFVTWAFATNRDEAINIANAKTMAMLPGDWTIVMSFAGALKRELLEEIAEQVLGWKRPEA